MTRLSPLCHVQGSKGAGPCRCHRLSVVAEGASWVGEIGGADFYLFSCPRCVPETNDSDSDEPRRRAEWRGMGEAAGGTGTAGCASGRLTRLGSQPCAPGRGLVRSPLPLQEELVARPWPGAGDMFRLSSSMALEADQVSRPHLQGTEYAAAQPGAASLGARVGTWRTSRFSVFPSVARRRGDLGGLGGVPQLILHDCSQSDKSHRQCRPKPKRAPSKGPACGRQRCFSAEGLVAWCEY